MFQQTQQKRPQFNGMRDLCVLMINRTHMASTNTPSPFGVNKCELQSNSLSRPAPIPDTMMAPIPSNKTNSIGKSPSKRPAFMLSVADEPTNDNKPGAAMSASSTTTTNSGKRSGWLGLFVVYFEIPPTYTHSRMGQG